MPVTINPTPDQRGRFVVRLTGGASAAAAGLGAVANPEEVPLLILRTQLYIETPSAGAANLSVGMAANATSSATDIINALAVSCAIAGRAYNGNTIQATANAEITVPLVWTTSRFLTFTGSATTVGLVAHLIVEYVRLP